MRKAVNKMWGCVMHWDHTPATQRLLLVVLLERVLPFLDKPLLLTDYLMDSLDSGQSHVFSHVFTVHIFLKVSKCQRF